MKKKKLQRFSAYNINFVIKILNILKECCKQDEVFHVNSLVITILFFSNNWYTWKKQQHLHSKLEIENVNNYDINHIIV